MGYGWNDDIEPKYFIDAVVEYEWLEVERAAALIERRQGWDYTDEQLDKYNEFIANVLNIIASSGFTIIDSGQSKESYSYYINFVPFDNEGNPMDIVQVRFRISDHRLRGGGDNIGLRSIFKSFRFGGEKYENMHDLVIGVEKACDAIRRGDWNALEKL